MNTKRLLLWALVLMLVCCSGTAFAANTVVINDQSVAKGATGVQIPILFANDAQIKGIILPLALREQTPGAFVTSITMAFADRLTLGLGKLEPIIYRNQYANEDGACKQNLPGGFGTITSATGGPNPVVASPEGLLFARQALFASAYLDAGADATGSFVLTVDVTSVDGTFEIDTTCANPANHLSYLNIDNTATIPVFNKATITIGNPVTNTPPVAVCQPLTVFGGENCSVNIPAAALDGGSFDPDGDAITLALNPPGPFGFGINDVYLVVTDDIGDKDSCLTTVTVNDETAPVITSCPGDVSVQCSADIPPVDIGAVVATDNCEVTVTHEGDVSDQQSCPETITRTYRATDGAGNFVECTQTITVQDTENPVLTGCPGDITVSCLADVPAAATVTADDNCDGSLAVNFNEVDNATANPCGGTIVRTWDATDACDNTAQCTQTITVSDTEDPVLTGCPTDITVSCLADVPAAATVTADDNCDGTLAVNFNEVDNATGNPCGGTIVRTWDATDACGNTAQCTQTITVNDTDAPVITVCAPDISVQCESDVPPADIGLITATDNCGAPTITHVSDAPLAGGACGGTIARTYRATDACGNFVECTQTITVEDTENPTLVASVSNLDFQCPNEIPAILESDVTFTDNCSTPTITTSRIDNGGAGSVGDPLVYTDTYIATDACGNTAQVSRTITVIDDISPSLTCPANMTVQEDSPGNGAVVTWSNPAIVDNCSGGSVAQIAGPISGSTFLVGSSPYTVTYEATDAAGNTAQCSFTVTVTEGIPDPVAQCKDITVDADENCQAAVTPAEVDNGSTGSNIVLTLDPPGPYDLGANSVELVVTDDQASEVRCSATITVVDNTDPVIACTGDWNQNNDPGLCGADVVFEGSDWATATDNCPGATVSYEPPSGFFPVGTTPVVATATDAAGNTSTCSFDVIIADVEDPTITCAPSPVYLSLGENCEVGLSDFIGLGLYQIDDNCNGPGALTLDQSPAPGTILAGAGTSVLVTLTVTDPAGNSASCDFEVIARDDLPPTAQCPADITVGNDAGQCGAIVNWSASILDNCPGGTVTCNPTPGSFFPIGTTEVFCSAVDASGNSSVSDCSFFVTVEDTEDPVAQCPGDIQMVVGTGETEAIVTWSSNVTDNCPGATIACVPPSGSTFPLGETSVTCTATDAAGNTHQCSFTVSVSTELLPPVALCTDITVDAGANCEADASIDNGSYDPDGGSVTLSQDPPGPYALGTTVVTLTVTDNENDQNTCTATVTVEDNTPPSLTCPGDITVDNDPGECGAVVTFESTAYDDCDLASHVIDPASGSFFPVGTSSVSVTATDGAGNVSQCSFDVTVNDVEPPVVQCPNDMDFDNDPGECGAVVNWLDGLAQTDNCDVTFTYDPPSGSFLPIGDNLITGTGVDPSGNEATCTFTVTVHDTEAPIASCPGDIVMDINAPATETVVNWTSTVDDNCPGATIACVPPSGSIFGLGTTPVTCTATDAAGNTHECSFTVTINQVSNPILDAAPDTIYVSAIVDGPNPPPSQAAVNNAGTGGPIDYIICEEVPWLSVGQLSGSTNSFFDIAYDITGLTPQVYYGKICVSENAPDKIIDCCPDFGLRDSVIVELTILAQCDQAQLVAEPSSLTFYSRDCERTPLCQGVTINSSIPDCNKPWYAESGSPWITSIEPGQGVAPTDVQICVDPTGLAPGIYEASVYVYNGPAKSEQTGLIIPVTLKVEDATIFMTDICGSPGEIVNLCVNYCTNVDLSGLSVGLCYDSDLIRVIDATFEGSAVQQYETVWSVDDIAQTICLAAFPIGQEPIDSGCGLFATVHFEILGGCPDGASIPIYQCDIAPGDTRVDGCGLLATDTELLPFCTNFEPGEICVECPCSICGHVYENGDGPIFNGLVQLWDSYPGGTLLDEALTNEAGGFCFSDGVIPDTPYDLRIVAEGYCTKIWGDVSCGGNDEEIGIDPLPEIPSRPYSASWWSNNATNEGAPLLPGDVILAMDPQGNIVGLDIVSVEGQYLIDVVSDDPTTPGVDDGANEGEAITLYLDCECPLAAPGEWHAFGDIEFDADFDCRLQPIEIPLCDSWTLVSFNVLPPNPAIGPVLSSIDGLYDYLLSATCQTGNDSWAKDRPSNDLNTLDPWHGFWIKPSTSGVGPVVVLGSYIFPDTPLDLCAGWNVVSYLPGEADDLGHALSSIDGKYTYVISSECDGPHSWAANRDPANNDLYCLKPGHGYWIYMTEAASLTYPTSGYSCTEGDPLYASAGSRVTITPLVTDFWSEADASVSGLKSGDHLTVRTQTGAVCGETVVGPNGMFLVHVFGDDPTTEYVDGAHEGEELVIEVNGVAAQVTSGSTVFHEKQFAQITVQSASAGPLPRDYALLQNYPNPFNPSTTIAFRMPEAADVSITVYNVLGQPVRTVFEGYLPAGAHTVEWDGRFDNGQTAQSGIYLYRLKTANWSDAKKMTLVK